MGIALTVLVVFWTMGLSDVAAERIRILDRCDPATFNAAGPVLCNPNIDGGVSLEEFLELLTPAGFGHPAWRFNAPYVAIDPYERVRVTNRGGEDHTFTEVPELEEGKNPFGGGRGCPQRAVWINASSSVRSGCRPCDSSWGQYTDKNSVKAPTIFSVVFILGCMRLSK
jgi:hypothetical protein